MNARHAGRIWAMAGTLAAVALLAVGWFLLIGPQQSQTRDLHDQTSAAHDQAASQQRRLAELRRQERDMPRYEAELAANRKALPAVPGTPAFVRQLQAAGDATGVLVSGVAVAEPIAEEGVFTLPIALTAEGGDTQLEAFLDELQTVQPRAVLVDTVSAAEASAEAPGQLIMTISLNAFVAPTIGK
jgi:type IV pilus assembly protein PilO